MQKTTVKQAVYSAQRMKNTKKLPLLQMCGTVLCFLIARAEMFGTATPLGIAFMAAAGKDGIWRLVYMLAASAALLTTPSGFVYIPAAVLLFFITYFENKSVPHNRLSSALYACGSVLVSGLPAVLWLGGYALDMLKLLICSFGAFFGVYVFGTATSVLKKEKRKFLTQEEVISVAITLSVAALGLPFGKIGYVTPINVICAFIVLSFSCAGNVGRGAASGVVCGFITGCGGGNPFPNMGTFGFCGLAAGLMGQFGKVGSAAAFILCAVVNAASVPNTEGVVLPPLDTALAVLAFFAVPSCVFKSIGICNVPKSEEADTAVSSVRDKLGFLSGAFSQMAESIKFFGSGGGKDRFSRFDMFDSAADSVCRDCKNCTVCWQKYYGDTYDVTMKCFHKADTDGCVSVDFLPEFFRERCCDCDGFIKSINRTYEQFKSELVWRGKLSKSNEISAGRFADAAAVVDALCADLRENTMFDAELARAVAGALDGAGISVNSVSVFKNPYGRYELKIKFSGCGGRDMCLRAEPIISEIMECGMAKREGDCALGECCVVFSEMDVLAVEHSVAGCAAEGEDVSGDCAVAYTMPDGNEFLLICDGRGSGGEANLVSCETVRLISKLMNAGFTPDAAVRLADAAMTECCDDEQFSTVDAAIIDTLNGSCIFVKNGCCPTFLINNGEIKRVACSNLPVGAGCSGEICETYEKLEDGTVIVMMSDGVYDAFTSEKELKSELSSLSENTSAAKISSKLIKKAKNRCGKRDDMTVLTAKISFKN